MNNFLKIVVASALFATIFFSPSAALAQDEVKLDNPIEIKNEKGATLKDSEITPSHIIGVVIQSFLGLVGGVSLVMMVWGGFQWLTSAGNPEKVKKGTQTMIWSVIGLIIALASYLLVKTVLGFIAGGKGG